MLNPAAPSAADPTRPEAGVDYAALFSRARHLSLQRCTDSCDQAAQRLRFAVSTARAGYSSGLALVSVALDEYIGEVRTTLELSGAGEMANAEILPAVEPELDVEVGRTIRRLQSSIDGLVDLFEDSRRAVLQQGHEALAAASVEGAAHQPDAQLTGDEHFMAGFEVILASMYRLHQSMREHDHYGLWGRMRRAEATKPETPPAPVEHSQTGAAPAGAGEFTPSAHELQQLASEMARGAHQGAHHAHR